MGPTNLENGRIVRDTYGSADDYGTRQTKDSPNHDNVKDTEGGMTGMKLLLSSKDGRKKLFATLLVYIDYFAFAWIFMVVGPTLPGLRKIVEVDLQTSSWIFTCFSLGYALGCPLHGLLYSKVNNVLLMTVFATVDGILWIVTPWCSDFWLLLLVRVVGGMAWGGTDSACHSELFTIWGAKAGPWVQLLYLLMGLGGMGSSFAITPLLGPTNNETTYTESNNLTLAAAVNVGVEALDRNASSSIDMTKSTSPITNLQLIYIIAGLVSIVAAVPLFMKYIFANHSSETRKTDIKMPVEKARKNPNVNFVLTMILLMVLNVIITGIIDTYAAFYVTFAIDQLGWSNQDGALAVGVYFVGLSLGNITFAFSTLCLGLKTGPLFLSASLGTVLSVVGLTLSAIFHVDAGVWLFDATTGFMAAALWPAFFTFVEERIVSIAGTIGAILLGAGALGALSNPLIVGYTMDNISPLSYCYVILIESVLAFVCFLCISYMYRDRKDTTCSTYAAM